MYFFDCEENVKYRSSTKLHQHSFKILSLQRNSFGDWCYDEYQFYLLIEKTINFHCILQSSKHFSQTDLGIISSSFCIFSFNASTFSMRFLRSDSLSWRNNIVYSMLLVFTRIIAYKMNVSRCIDSFRSENKYGSGFEIW